MNEATLKSGGNILRKCGSSPLFIYFCIAAFFLLKMSHLAIPYFWDELGVYSMAALYMHDHGLTILPGVIPADLSRGHPLLCAAVFGAMYKVLGPHVWVGHLAALIMSCGLLVLLYEAGKALTRHHVAGLACLMLMVQPVFIAQSTMVLPEVMLALLCTAAMFAYAKNRLGLFALFSSFAILTKETAIALPAAIGCLELAQVMVTRRLSKDSVLALLAALTPICCWLVFLLLQREKHGWFFFPLHTDYVSFSLQQILSRLSYYLSFLFKGQGRYLWTVVILLAVSRYYFRNSREFFKTLLEQLLKALAARRFLLSGLVFLCFGLLVSMLNFHLARYALFIMPVSCLIVSMLFFFFAERFNRMRFTAVLLICLPFFYYSPDDFNFDADMGYLHIVRTQLAVSEYLNDNFSSSTVICSDFPVNFGLMDQRAGYVQHSYPNQMLSCNTEKGAMTDVYVFTSPGNLEYSKPDMRYLGLVKEYTSSFSRALIYTRLE